MKFMNILFVGNFLYPIGMAATRRKQQFMDYFISKGAIVKALILIQGSHRNLKKNQKKGIHRKIQYIIIGNKIGRGNSKL